MPAQMVRTVTVAVVAICLAHGAFAADGGWPRHAPASLHGSASSRSEHAQFVVRKDGLTGKPKTARKLAADRDPYANPAAPYKADRLSWGNQPILNIPGQVTVLTRQILDDKNATTLRDALGTTAGVTVGR